MAEVAEHKPVGAGAPTMLERIFNDGRLVRDEHQAAGARRMLHGFVDEAAALGASADGGAKRALAARIAALDVLIARQVNQVLHHEKFQRLEASWRNLDKLVGEHDLTNAKVRVFNTHRRELERDFRRAAGFDQSYFFRNVYESEYGTLGGSPYTFLVGDMEFGRSPRDIQFLRDASAVAAMAHAPFIAGAAPGLLDLDSFTELDRPIDVAKILATSEMAGWNALRDSPDSRYLVLTAPRVMVRPPWSPDAMPTAGVGFMEEVDGEHRKYLWGPSSWALGGRIMASFAGSGWPCAIRGAETGGKVANLPLHAYRAPTGAKAVKCPTETTITDRREKELSDEGIVALCNARNTDFAVIFSGATVNRPRRYVEEEANANARLSASLPYVLACARFAHYLKAIIRDKVGGFRSGAEIQALLGNWIAQYVTSDDNAAHATKARYPLREAHIEIREVPGRPGAYAAVARLRPHFQLEQLTASLRLVAELPT